MSEVQSLVDALAVAVERPVAVDDPRFRLVAYSPHAEEVDAVRRTSILRREAPSEVIAWLESMGIRDADACVHLPANASLGMLARACFPIRFNTALFGYLWLVDEPALDTSEMQLAERAVQDLSLALYRMRRQAQDDAHREQELLARLLVKGDDALQSAADLVQEGFILSAGHYAVTVVQAARTGEHRVPDAVRVRLVSAVRRVRKRVAPHQLLTLVHGDEVVCVVAFDDPSEFDRINRGLTGAVEFKLSDTPEWEGLIGVGDPRRELADIASAYQEAHLAAGIAERIPDERPLAAWDSLGAYRTITKLMGSVEPTAPLPDGVVRLLSTSDDGALVETLETFLEHAGDVRSTAAALFVHRSSLYGRLRRIEAVAGVDLSSGDARLELHVGLRLWRLGGGLRPSDASFAAAATHDQRRGQSSAL